MRAAADCAIPETPLILIPSMLKKGLGLTIGRFKSAWLVDLVVAYLFEVLEPMFQEYKIF